MARVAVRESVTLAGMPERARLARSFVGGVLGPGHPCADDAQLLVSELFGNSVRHSRSGDPGETVTVAVKMVDGVVRIEVPDRSGSEKPELDLAPCAPARRPGHFPGPVRAGKGGCAAD
jgi:anti-sigma regulatory factor (Ser/Thr protein kinase)